MIDIRSLRDKTTIKYRINDLDWKVGLLRMRTRKLDLPVKYRGGGELFWRAGDPSMLWIENEPDAEFGPEDFKEGMFRTPHATCEILLASAA